MSWLIPLSISMITTLAASPLYAAPQAKKAAARASSARTSQFAALAIDRSKNFVYGFAFDQPTRADAERIALEEVQRRGGNGSIVLRWSGAGCGAYRTTDPKFGTAYGWGVAGTQQGADQIAIAQALKRSKGALTINSAWACNSLKTSPLEVEFIDPNISSVTVGGQEWSSHTVDIVRFQNGDLIPLFTDAVKFESEGRSGKPAAFCFDSQSCDKFSKYYNFYALTDPRGFAPPGWRVPIADDFRILISFASNSGTRLRLPTGWPTWSAAVGNPTGFGALPTGTGFSNSTSKDLAAGFEGHAVYWTITKDSYKDTYTTFFLGSYDSGDQVKFGNQSPSAPIAVRLIRAR